MNPLVVDAGPSLEHRSQDDPRLVVEGLGGAGLYSDGKFSFWPSATQLWRLDDALLARSSGATWSLLASVGIPHSSPTSSPLGNSIGGHWEKCYPSVYASGDARSALINTLHSRAPRTLLNTRVISLSPAGNGWVIQTDQGELATRGIVLASGRFGPLLLGSGNLALANMRPLRLEVGVRIEQPSNLFFLRDHPQLDPKLIWRANSSGTSEWRTFCCCREGMVLTTCTAGLVTVSGRSDCDPTGRSNVGFNVRVTDREGVVSGAGQLIDFVRSLDAPRTTMLEEAIGPQGRAYLEPMVGPGLAARLLAGIGLLLEDFPAKSLTAAELTGPTLEGIGVYPVHDRTLATSAPNLWVSGDATGSFRGLTAALISGFIAGYAAKRSLGGDY